MAMNERDKIGDKTRLADLTVGELKILIHALMHQQMLELLQDFENYLPDPEAGWSVQPEVWAQVRAFIQREIRKRESPGERHEKS